MRKIVVIVVVAAVFLLLPGTSVDACQVCGWSVSGTSDPYVDCRFPVSGQWGYEFCEVRSLPKPGYFTYCVQSGAQCLYIEVR